MSLVHVHVYNPKYAKFVSMQSGKVVGDYKASKQYVPVCTLDYHCGISVYFLPGLLWMFKSWNLIHLDLSRF